MVAYTTNFSIPKPTVGGDLDAWGGYQNDGMDIIDTAVFARQPKDATLTAFAAQTTGADLIWYWTGTDAGATTALTSFARTLLDDADAATARATLGLGTASTKSTGTSGNTVPLLDGANTWSSANTFSADITLSAGASDRYLIINSNAGQNRIISFRTAGLQRFLLFTDNSAEAGANAGSNFKLDAYSDAGTGIGNVFAVTRATRVMSFGVTPTVGSDPVVTTARTASTSQTGIAEIADQSEMEAATDTARVPSVSAMRYHPGTAKVRALFNGTGTPAISEGDNLASITDHGVGNYTLNFTPTFGAATYAFFGSVNSFGSSDAGANNVHIEAASIGGAATTKTTTALRIIVGGSGGAEQDASYVSVALFGDL